MEIVGTNAFWMAQSQTAERIKQLETALREIAAPGYSHTSMESYFWMKERARRALEWKS